MSTLVGGIICISSCRCHSSIICPSSSTSSTWGGSIASCHGGIIHSCICPSLCLCHIYPSSCLCRWSSSYKISKKSVIIERWLIIAIRDNKYFCNVFVCNLYAAAKAYLTCQITLRTHLHISQTSGNEQKSHGCWLMISSSAAMGVPQNQMATNERAQTLLTIGYLHTLVVIIVNSIVNRKAQGSKAMHDFWYFRCLRNCCNFGPVQMFF